jgi:hypothetical protein
LFLFPCKAHIREAPLPPKTIPISDAKSESKTHPYTRLSWSWRSFLCCRDVDKRCPMYWTWFELSKACNRGASRPSEAWPRPRLGRKTYWHKDKARLTGTRNYIILLLEP